MAVSRIGKEPVEIPSGVTVTLDGLKVNVKGPKGTLDREFVEVGIAIEGNQVLLSQDGNEKSSKAMHGLGRALLQNMVTGVSDGFKRQLEINGVGYRAEVKGKTLVLSLGFSHPVEYPVPENVTITCEKPTSILLESIDKELLGRVTAKIRSFRPPEPYKGKGIKYVEERIRRKVGKAGAAA